MLKTIGKVAGGIGLLFVLTSWVTALITLGSLTAFWVKLGLGSALIVLWAVTNRGKLGTFGRRTFFYSSSVLFGAAALVLLIGANFIVAKRNKTWDLTNKKIYSLSAQTVQVLKDLKEPVKAITYVPGPVPEPIENLFQRYGAETDKLTWEFRDPRKDPQGAAEYQLREGQAGTVLVTGEGAAKTHTMVNINKIASAALGEQELTNGLVKLTSVGGQRLYFVQGHNEWPLDAAGQGEEAAAGSLAALKRVVTDEGYEPQALSIVERGEIPPDASALVIAGPRSPFTAREVELVGQYLAQGGRVLYLAEGDAPTGLEPLLTKYGIQLEPGLVADSKFQPDDPYVVVAPFFGEHEIVAHLKQQKQPAVFPSVRAITVLKGGVLPGVQVTPLVMTSPNAWVERNPTDQPELNDGERAGQLSLAVVATVDTKTAPSKKNDEARLIVFGDSDAVAGAFGYDRNLVMNSLAWLTAQAQKITIRPADRDISTIDIDAQRFANIRLLSMDVFPMLLMGVGLTIWLTRRAR